MRCLVLLLLMGLIRSAEHPALALLERSCVACHQPSKAKGGLDLSTRAGALHGGDDGAALVPGKAGDSTLYRRATHQDEPGMPAKKPKLPDADLALLKAWIDAGAPWERTLSAVVSDDRAHWAFRPLVRPPVPTPRDGGWGRTPVDAFIRAGQEGLGVAPAPEADRRTLVRRLCYDLSGLPPEPGLLLATLNDPRSDWYEQLVDQLLASPRHGERWGRHWLDVARYADSDGYEADGDRPGAWHYRDAVIRAFNDDLPMDRFLQWQLAGDELAPQDPQAVAATGFCTAGPVMIFTGNALEGTPLERAQARADELDDVVSTLGSAMLGLTIGCARCHDHKYDPLPTRDYYRLAATFATSQRVGRSASTKDGKDWQAEIARPLHLADRQATPVQAFLLRRGDPAHPDGAVGAGFLTLFAERGDDGFSRWFRQSPPSTASSTFQRTALARWLTDVEHGAGALAARVLVNRVWQHHFGEGLCRTPNDVGMQGDRPALPALLDWLAAELLANGWRLKPLQRAIVLSATYRQGIAGDAAKAERDPDNRAWWHRRPLRLEAEAQRDAMLAVAAALDLTPGGPSVKEAMPAEARAGRDKDVMPRPQALGEGPWRRSVYLFTKRSAPQPLIEVFDGASPSASCGRRNRSTVATQALILLNDPFVRRVAQRFAERVRREAGAEPARQAELAMRLAFARAPSAAEAARLGAFLAADPNALTDLCHVLLTSNEFTHVD